MRRALRAKIRRPYRGRRRRRDRCYCGAPEPEAIPRPAQWSKRAGGLERDRRRLHAARIRSWLYRLLVSEPYPTLKRSRRAPLAVAFPARLGLYPSLYLEDFMRGVD